MRGLRRSANAAHRAAPPADMDWLQHIQWPAMAVTVAGAWLVASQRKFKRNWGFWIFLLSNLLWVIWGLYDRAYALVFLQLCLATMNIRGVRKNRVPS
jgi:hypothetical protein